MHVDHISADDHAKWNALAAREPSFGLLQSWEWGAFKETLGWKAFRIAVEQTGQLVAGAQMLVKSSLAGAVSFAYIPRGPVGNWLDEEISLRLLTELHQVARSHGATFLKIEPPLLSGPGFDETLKQHAFRASPHTNQPRCTLILELDQDLDEILMQMRKKTRQYIRKAIREGITIRAGSHEDLPAFYELMRATGRQRGFAHRSRDYYENAWRVFSVRNQAVLLMAFHEGQLLAVRTVYCFGEHAAEFHAGSSSYTTRLNPNHLLVWEGIKWAQKQGCSTYDLWGIPNEIGQTTNKENHIPKPHRTDGMWGVYQYKRGFSQNIVAYVGAYDYVYRPLLYALISNRHISADILGRAPAWMDWL